MTKVYTKDQLRAIDAIINKRPRYMNVDQKLIYNDRNVVLSDNTLLVLQAPIWNTGTEFDVGRLIKSNETRDCVTVFNVSTERTHYLGEWNYCKLADDAFFNPKILKRAFRAMKYLEEDVTLHYSVDSKTQQKYCRCMTFRTKYGFALVMACRVKDESELHEVTR